jgi:hypothetical protein
VDAPNSVFGATAEERGSRRKETGDLDEDEVFATLRYFHTPSAYGAAVEALVADHVVVLAGPSGSGRRCAALALLHEVTDQRLIALPPVLTIKDLAARTYVNGCGYVVLDRFDEGVSVNTDHSWLTVRDQVRKAGAHLVVTTTKTAAGRRVEAVRHIPWLRPPLRDVLRSHLPLEPDEVIESLLKKIPAEWTMRSVDRMAQAIRGGTPREIALEEFKLASIEQVHTWFGEEGCRTRREIVEVTALAFVSGANRRTFESLVTRLEKQLETDFPPPEVTGEDAIPAARTSHTDPDGLICVEQLTTGVAVRQAVTFRSPDIRRNVLAGLWARYPAPFWDAIRIWLFEVLDEYDNVQLAYGLALFATVADFDEVDKSYLGPWSAGEAGTAGQLAAVYVLWLMCREESVRRLALQTAIGWTGSRNVTQRWSAMLAFTGELGVRYPFEAVRRLWQLITLGKELSDDGCEALATLFTVLGNEPGGAGVILTMLDRHLARFGHPGGDRRLMRLTMDCVIAVLAIRDFHTGRPSILRDVRPDSMNTAKVARLWAAVLRHRGYRRAAVEALIELLRALDSVSQEPRREAAALGAELRKALPPVEYEELRRDVIELSARARQRPSEDLVRALLDAIDQLPQPLPERTQVI